MLQLLFYMDRRITRFTFWVAIISVSLIFILLFSGMNALIGDKSTLALYLPFFWILFSLFSKRYHDLNRSAIWLLLLAVPLFGVLWVAVELGFRRGTNGENSYGADPLLPVADYLEVK